MEMKAKSSSNVIYMDEWLALRDMRMFQKMNPLETDDYLNFIYGKPVDLVFMLTSSIKQVNSDAGSNKDADEEISQLLEEFRSPLLYNETEEMDKDE